MLAGRWKVAAGEPHIAEVVVRFGVSRVRFDDFLEVRLGLGELLGFGVLQ